MWGISVTIFTLTIALSAVANAAKFYCSSGDATCLIAAINSANRTKGPHTIFLEPGTYTLTQVNNVTAGSNGLPSIKSTLLIDGSVPGAVTIERDPSAEPFRLFHVSQTGNITLRYLRLQHGAGAGAPGTKQGGAILNLGTMTILGSVISQNTSVESLIENRGELTITQSRVEDNSAPGHDGIIASDGNTSIKYSSITRNRHIGPIIRNTTIVSSGLSGGTMNIENSAITENESDTSLISNPGGVINLVNTTVGNNSQRFGGPALSSFSGGYTTVSNSSIIANHSPVTFVTGVSNSGGTLSLINSIVAFNTNGNSSLADCSGEITSLGNNIIGSITTSIQPCVITLQVTDLTGDPRLNDLTDDGNPGFAHYPLLSNSPAINSGNTTFCSKTDQLGFFRAGTCDIGAVEYQPGPLPVSLELQPNNKVNLKGNGSVSVAILSSPSFDASAVDPQSVRLGLNQALDTDGKGHVRDVNHDRLNDLLLIFGSIEAGIQCGDTSVTLTGETFSGQQISGVATIHPFGCN